MTHNFRSELKSQLSIGLAIVAVLSVIPVLFGGTKPTPATAPITPPITPVGRHDVLGESVTASAYSVKVTAVDTAPVDSSTATQRSTIHVSITNTSGVVLQIAPGLQMTLIDASGVVYAATAQYLDPSEVIGGPLAAGQTATLAVDFALSASHVASQFIFQADASSAAAKVAL